MPPKRKRDAKDTGGAGKRAKPSQEPSKSSRGGSKPAPAPQSSKSAKPGGAPVTYASNPTKWKVNLPKNHGKSPQV